VRTAPPRRSVARCTVSAPRDVEGLAQDTRSTSAATPPATRASHSRTSATPGTEHAQEFAVLLAPDLVATGAVSRDTVPAKLSSKVTVCTALQTTSISTEAVCRRSRDVQTWDEAGDTCRLVEVVGHHSHHTRPGRTAHTTQLERSTARCDQICATCSRGTAPA
jgi:hypothetical protein